MKQDQVNASQELVGERLESPRPAQQCQYRDRALDALVWELAEVGVYPEKVIGGNHPYEKRSDWQEGWNACSGAQLENRSRIEEWLEALPVEHKTAIEELLLSERLGLHVDDAGINLYVNCSDTFYWGCADAERIAFEELDALSDCYVASPVHGGELWAARKRGMRPQTASYRECYQVGEWHLFDAAGPVRTDSDGADRDKLTEAEAMEYRARRK